MRTNGRFVSGAFGLVGVIGAVPEEPPAMPLPNLGLTEPPSQLITATIPTTSTVKRTRGERILMSFKSSRRAPRLHRHVAFVDDVRRAQDQEVPLGLAPIRHAEEAADEREIDQERHA